MNPTDYASTGTTHPPKSQIHQSLVQDGVDVGSRALTGTEARPIVRPKHCPGRMGRARRCLPLKHLRMAAGPCERRPGPIDDSIVRQQTREVLSLRETDAVPWRCYPPFSTTRFRHSGFGVQIRIDAS